MKFARSITVIVILLSCGWAVYAVVALSPETGVSTKEDSTRSTPHIEKFHLQDCSHDNCIEATGDVAYVSNARASLSASSVALEIRKQGAPARHVDCAEFRYDLETQLAMCDNRNVKRPSLTLDQKFEIAEYR